MEHTPDSEFSSKIENALRDEFSGNNLMLTKFVLVGENILPDGERRMWVSRSEDMGPWDTMGMLNFVLQLETSKIIVHDFIDHGIYPDGD